MSTGSCEGWKIEKLNEKLSRFNSQFKTTQKRPARKTTRTIQFKCKKKLREIGNIVKM